MDVDLWDVLPDSPAPEPRVPHAPPQLLFLQFRVPLTASHPADLCPSPHPSPRCHPLHTSEHKAWAFPVTPCKDPEGSLQDQAFPAGVVPLTALSFPIYILFFPLWPRTCLSSPLFGSFWLPTTDFQATGALMAGSWGYLVSLSRRLPCMRYVRVTSLNSRHPCRPGE